MKNIYNDKKNIGGNEEEDSEVFNVTSSGEASPRKYMTVTIGKDFRTIAKIMSSNDYKMNHATARNQTFGALHNLLLNFSKEAKGKKVKSKEMYEILGDPEIYDNLSEVLFASVKKDIGSLLSKEKSKMKMKMEKDKK